MNMDNMDNMDNTDKSELRECPFCGSSDLYLTYMSGYQDDTYVVFCNSCKVSVVAEDNEQEGINDQTKERAIEAWNTRAEKSCKQTQKDGECVWLTD